LGLSRRSDRGLRAGLPGRGAAALIGGLAFVVSAMWVVAAPVALAQAWSVRDSEPCKPSELSISDKLFNRRLYARISVRLVSGLRIVAEETEVPFEVARDLRQTLAKVKDGQQVRVFGFLAKTPPTGARLFYVRRLEVELVDIKGARAEVERLRAAGDVAGLLRLGDKIVRLRGSIPAAAEEIGRDAFRAAAALIGKNAAAGDRVAALALADVCAKRLGDRARALQALAAIIPEDGRIPHDVDKRLQAIRAVRYGPERRWVLFEEMKRQEGFLLREGRWVLAERARFLDSIVGRKKRRNPKKPLREEGLEGVYANAAAAKQLLDGMTKREVVQSRGYPDTFDRVLFETRLYDAWVYADGTRLYFENGFLFQH